MRRPMASSALRGCVLSLVWRSAERKEAMKADGLRIRTDGCGSSYTNTLIPLQRLHSLACSYRGSRRPLFPAKAGRGSPSARRSSLLHLACAYAKDRASLPHDGLLEDNPPPFQAKHEQRFTAGFGSGTDANPAWVDLSPEGGDGMEKCFRCGWAAPAPGDSGVRLADRRRTECTSEGTRRSRTRGTRLRVMNILNMPLTGQ